MLDIIKKVLDIIKKVYGENIMKVTRRKFVAGAGSLAFAGLTNYLSGCSYYAKSKSIPAYGPLVEARDAILDLPEGFSYKTISRQGDQMDDGYVVPKNADGMGCFALEGSKVALVRNHEIGHKNPDPEELKKLKPLLSHAYDHTDVGEPLLGGTTTIIYDVAEEKRVSEYYSLVGTSTNCAGGITPWGSWLTCEETTRKSGEGCQHDHGWVFEVLANANGPVKPIPLKAMGRFNHEAAAVDPRTGIVYLTEDRENSLFYRFIPNVYGDLLKGGKLQALGVQDVASGFDSRNWDGRSFEPESWRNVRWIDLENIESPEDDLRMRGFKNGAAVFARGEGIFWGDNELYFCCSTGGVKNLGQVMRYKPSLNEGKPNEDDDPGRLQLFFESVQKETFGLGDNITVAPNGHLIICEDHYDGTINHIRGITPSGELYTLAKVNVKSETAGVCFSPDGTTMFVNVQYPTQTLAIKGPWTQFLL